jgi:hypothetical protein
MTFDKFLKELSEDQKSLSLRIFDLVIGRVLKTAYSKMDEAQQKGMEEVFFSDDDTAKEYFVEKNIPDFKELFTEQAKIIEEELKLEIEKQG